MINRIRYKLKTRSGFTLVELMIATSVFSVVLLITTFGIIQISRSYIRGSVTAQVDNSNRSIVSAISQQIELNNNSGTIQVKGPVNWNADPSTYYFCANGVRFIYQYNNPVPSALTEDNLGANCPAPTGGNIPSFATGEESLLAKNMLIRPPVNLPASVAGTPMVYQLNSDTPNLYGISLDLLYGSPGSYNPSTFVCNNLNKGGSFCDNSTITTAVNIRVPQDF